MSDTKTVYLNGTYLPEDQAFIPVTDRGFVFGDGVYEVIPVYGGHLFRLEEHLSRLNNSLKGIRLDNPLNHDQWETVLEDLVEKNGGGEQSLYLQVTRGQAPRDHSFPEEVTPTIFASASPLKPVAEQLRHGVAAITLEDIRWKNCHIKAIALLPNILLRQQANDEGAYEAILVRDDKITEGSASNVFIVKNGIIKTPPKNSFLLPGVTRDLVLELAAANQLSYEECSFSPLELKEADEIWLSSSTKEILPVTALNGQPIQDGHPGPMWQQIIKLYQQYKGDLIAGKAT
ncbi:D-amino-acid transaminase [Pseudomonadota bacterium]